MKLHTKWIATALAVAGGLAVVSSAQAQPVTGDANLDNILPAPVYDGWNSPLATITSTPNGLNVFAFAGGSGYFYIPPTLQQIINPADNQVSLTMTVSTPATWTSTAWIGAPVLLTDSAETGTSYGGYVGEFGFFPNSGSGTATYNGNTVTVTCPLDPAQLAAVQTGTDAITGFNLEFYPAFGASPYNVTFDSLVLSSSVPEPSTLALVGSGVAGLLAFCRRNK